MTRHCVACGHELPPLSLAEQPPTAEEIIAAVGFYAATPEQDKLVHPRAYSRLAEYALKKLLAAPCSQSPK